MRRPTLRNSAITVTQSKVNLERIRAIAVPAIKAGQKVEIEIIPALPAKNWSCVGIATDRAFCFLNQAGGTSPTKPSHKDLYASYDSTDAVALCSKR